MPTADPVDQYLASFEGEARETLTALRALARRAAPQATEALKWGTPAYSTRTILFVLAGYSKHANVTFTPSTREAFDPELVAFETGKGSVKIPYGREIPVDLLQRMIAYRREECEVRGVNWM